MSVGLHSDMIPIDIMVKYSPPMIALHYKMQNQSEDYLHQIPINVKPTASAQAIYEELLVEHFAYIGPKTMRKPQVLKLLDKVIEFVTHKSVTFNPIKGAKDKLFQSPDLSSGSKERDEDNYVLDFEDMEEKEKKAAKAKKSKENAKAKAEKDKKSKKNENVEIRIDGENEENADSMRENVDGMNDGEEEVQRVFVEELGREVLMDKEGNLFDMDGNFIGKAGGEEDEEENNSERVEKPRQYARDI